MKNRYLLGVALVVTILVNVIGLAPAGQPAREILSGDQDASRPTFWNRMVLAQELSSTVGSVSSPGSCSMEPMPEVVHLGEEALLPAGSTYLAKGPRLVLFETFPHRLWEGQLGTSTNWVALVIPPEDTLWPPEGSTADAHPQPADPSAWVTPYNAWKVIKDWRTPFFLFSLHENPVDKASLGVYDAGWLIQFQVLDHLNYTFLGQERHAWVYLVREDGSEQMLGQLEIADPASMSITVPERGEVEIRTHDSTIWWARCVPPISLKVTKSADPDQVFEPGGFVSFGLRVENTSSLSLMLTALHDDLYGDIAGVGNPLIKSTSCTAPRRLPPGGSYKCAFSAGVFGNPGDSQTDVVTATAQDEEGREVQASDDAVVHIRDVPSTIDVTKTAAPTSIFEPGANVAYSVVVQNTSLVDNVTIHSVMDDRFGDIRGSCDAAIPATLPPSAAMTCQFTQYVGGNPGDQHVNVVVASGYDDDGEPVSDADDAEVTVKNLPSAIEVTKTASPDWMKYPGGDVTFRVTVRNMSAVDSVTIDTLTDTIYGDLYGRGDCSVPRGLPVGGSFSCSFIANVTGQRDSKTTHINVVTASGTDDDGQPVSDDDDARVTVDQDTTSVELTHFVVSGDGDRIVVEWATAWEQDNWGFDLYRSLTPDFDKAAWIHFALGLGPGYFLGRHYRYEDQDVVPGQTYYYWLKDIDTTGDSDSTGLYGPRSAALPHRIYLPVTVR